MKSPSVVPVSPSSLDPTQRSQEISAKPPRDIEQPLEHITVDVPFEFNSVHITPFHAKRVQDAVLSAPPDAEILITGRSDNVGPPRAQGLIAQARRLRLMALVAPLARGSRVSGTQEVAPPGHASREDRAMQRRGSVDISTPQATK